MGILTRLTRGCLRLGVRRWPAELRDDLAQEWLAELAALERAPGNAWRRLTFAVSLAASPLTYDEHGLPSSRGEWWRTPGRVLGASLGLLPSQWLRYPAVAAGTLLVFPTVFAPAVIALMLINVGGVLTALAGNPPINAADEDVILMVPAVLAGVVLGGLLVLGEAPRVSCANVDPCRNLGFDGDLRPE